MSRSAHLSRPPDLFAEASRAFPEGAADAMMLEDLADFDPEVMNLLDEVSDQLQASVLGSSARTDVADLDWTVLEAFAGFEGTSEPQRVSCKRSRVAAAAAGSASSAECHSPVSKIREKNRLAQARFRQKKRVRRSHVGV
jgi:hypothetical protein